MEAGIESLSMCCAGDAYEIPCFITVFQEISFSKQARCSEVVK